MCIKNGNEELWSDMMYIDRDLSHYVFYFLEVKESELAGRNCLMNLSLSKEDSAYLRKHRHK